MRGKHLHLVEANAPPQSPSVDLANALRAIGTIQPGDGEAFPQSLLSALLATVLAPFALYNHSGEQLYASEAFVQAIGDGSDRAAFAAMVEEFVKAVGKGRPEDAVHGDSRTIARPNATYRVEFQTLGESAGAPAILTILRDVTDMARVLDQARLAQSKLRDFVGCSSDWIWETDDRGRVVSLSTQVTRLLGAPAAAFAGRRFKDLGRFPGPEVSDLVDAEAFQLRQPVRSLRFDLVGKDGQAAPQIISGVPVFDERSGRFLGYRGTGTDISEQVTTTDALQASRDRLSGALTELKGKNKELEKAFAAADAGNRAKSAFLANISHELRTPLNAILGFAEVLKLELFGALGNSKYQTYSSDIYTSARHLLDLISNILDLSTLETGHKSLNMEVVDLIEEAQYCVRLMESDSRKKSIAIITDSPPFKVAGHGDRRSMRQVFTNLLNNSVKFTRPGGRVYVDFAVWDGNVAVFVRDTGVGIPEEDIERITRPFERSTAPYVRDQDGSGLGLALCQNLMSLQGGGLHIDSRLGEGTTVSVWLSEAGMTDGTTSPAR